jgi:hypothetical protein
MVDIVPLSVRAKHLQVFRRPLNLDDYDFSVAAAHLIASVNGKYALDDPRKD